MRNSLSSIALISAGASAIGEVVLIGLYYPFDLIKSRMQRRGVYKYNNVSDAIYQISKENTSKFKILNYYRGGSIYALTYGLYTVLEFTLYETLLAAGTKYTKQKNGIDGKELSETHGHARHRNMLHVITGSFLSGSIGAIIINPLEFLLANTQNSKRSLRQIIREVSSIHHFWQGVHFSMFYYGISASILFVTLEKVGEFMDCSFSEAD